MAQPDIREYAITSTGLFHYAVRDGSGRIRAKCDSASHVEPASPEYAIWWLSTNPLDLCRLCVEGNTL